MGWISPCGKCGFDNVYDATHCRGCGAPRPTLSEPPTQAELAETPDAILHQSFGRPIEEIEDDLRSMGLGRAVERIKRSGKFRKPTEERGGDEF